MYKYIIHILAAYKITLNIPIEAKEIIECCILLIIET